MTVSELIDLLCEQEREGRGGAEVIADGLAIDDLEYDRVAGTTILTVYSPLPDLLPEDVEAGEQYREDSYEDDYEPDFE